MRDELIHKLAQAQLYGIVDTLYLHGRSVDEVIQPMLAGGVDIVQLRAKHESIEEIAEMAAQLLKYTKPSGVPLIINDYPEVAYHTGADGAHVGQDDISVAEVRRLLGPGKIVGKSTHSIEQVHGAVAEQPDYIGVGPIFPTLTKPDYSAVGLELIRQVAVSKLTLPFFCIGGIKHTNINQVIEAGATRVVVVSGILEAPDIESMCRQLKSKLEQT
ncbi:MAG: thiamine phosphate synthase [Verrucomicrobiota bacterium]|mgnify:CR=1 FL=1|nr:thiamine phosphate synthase [Verrucomicrobiota bacterium]